MNLYPLLQDGSTNDVLSWGLRILTLLPGEEDSSIICGLSNTTLNSCKGNFEALSYVWGDKTITRSIFINGLPFEITLNLYTALSKLRVSDKARVLWVDAICINQLNLEERGLQVDRMWAIYAYAKGVLAFVGEEMEGSYEALRLIKKFGKIQEPEEVARMIDAVSEKDWGNLEKFVQRTYFRRVWVVQEVAVNKEVNVICGKMSLPWDYIHAAIRNIYYDNDIHRPWSISLATKIDFRAPYAICDARDDYQRHIENPTSLDLLMILDGVREHQSTDPRDKVFALLRFRGRLHHIAPNYSDSVTPSDVFKDLFQSFIRVGSLEILSYCGRQQPDYPSWCPDWTSVRYNHYPLIWDMFRADTSPVKALIRGNVLKVSAIVLGRLERLWGPPPDSGWHAKFTKTTLEDLESFVLGDVPPSKLSDTKLIFRRTIVSNLKWGSTGLNVQDIQQGYKEWKMSLVSPGTRATLQSRAYHRCVDLAFRSRQFFVTDTGIMGLVGEEAKIGDFVAVFSGGNVPFCISKSQQHSNECQEYYKFLGDCYVDTYMDGRAMEDVNRGIYRVEDICLM